MTPKQIQIARDGLQERIDKIAAKYQRDVLFNHHPIKSINSTAEL